MATAAERQRRHRSHKAGNHSLCDPARCDGTTAARDVTPVTGVTSSRGPVAPRFGPRGQQLWTDLNDGRRGPGELVLIEEACRLADRLDRLDAVLTGDQVAWMALRESDSGGPVTVVVDTALSQARMHATALRGIIAELRQSAGGNGPAVGQGGSVLDQLAARRKARLADATGQ